MYYHIIRNTQRGGRNGYQLVKTYRSMVWLDKYLAAHNEPVWILRSYYDRLVTTSNPPTFGGINCSYHNSGGWNQARMPLLPIFSR